MTPPRSSDILESQFGTTTVDVLHQDEHVRVIQTRVVGTDQILEFSSVTFNQQGVNEFADIHESIVGGESMGKAFKAAGVDFVRQTHAVSRLVAPPVFATLFDTDQPAWVVEVAIAAGKNQTPYADILEVYSGLIEWPEPAIEPTKQMLSRLDKFSQFVIDQKLKS